MQLHKAVLVHILDVESPHKFWFRTEKDASRLNEKLDSYVKQNAQNSNCTPKLLEWAVVKVNDRWEVAFMDNEDNFKIISSTDAFLLCDQTLIEMSIRSKLMGSVRGIIPKKVRT